MAETEDKRLTNVKNNITAVQDFPKPGIVFRDIFPLFQDPAVLSDAVSLLTEHVVSTCGSVDVIVGLESRGFLFGPMMAVQLGCAFVPFRKKGKLPGECVQVTYTLEYGDDTIEAQVGSIRRGQKVLILDDLIATGGTMSAASQLVEKMEGSIVECLVLIELAELGGSAKLNHPFHSIVQY